MNKIIKLFLILLGLQGMLLEAKAASSVFTQAVNAATDNTGNFVGDTNWVAIPYASLNTTTKEMGWGVALLHYAAQNLWVGVRFQDFAGQETTAGVQAQLQVTKSLGPFTYTPFLETSVGIGTSSLYGSAGTGIVVGIHTWDWRWSRWGMEAGFGSSWRIMSIKRDWPEEWRNLINAGPLLRLP